MSTQPDPVVIPMRPREAGASEPEGGLEPTRIRVARPLPAFEPSEVEPLIRRLAIHGLIPEPLRTAHLIATGIGPLPSRQRS